MSNTQTPICMCEEYWANSHFSVARYAGCIKAFGHEYQIVNKQGITTKADGGKTIWIISM